jgi:hypothetical protein
MALRQASPDSVSLGGTQLANALEKVNHKLLSASEPGMVDVVLISDGEEMQTHLESALNAARKLGQAGARLICIGVGDPHGSQIILKNPTNDTAKLLTYNGTAVWTRLHSKTLRAMAKSAKGGLYFEVADGPFDLTQIYRQIMDHAPKNLAQTSPLEEQEERFIWFIGAALFTLLLSYPWRKK